MTATPAHLAAMTYAAKGWRVIPITPGKKHPGINGWQNAATTDLSLIDQWWTTNPDDGVGIATGPASGVFVLDVDITDNKRGDDTLEDLELTYEPLPPTVECVTGSGGRHLYFAYPPGVEIRNDAGRKLGPGLDIRGTGGQVLAPPTIHPNGQPYTWETSGDPDDTDVADAPGWLIALLTHTPTPPPPRPTGTRADGDSPAARYNASTTWPELLERDGWTHDHTDQTGEQYWTRPGKDRRDGVSATVGWKGNDALKVFTTSLTWLPEHTYSRFGYYACRYHQGDRSAAARALLDAEHQGHNLADILPGDKGKPDPDTGTAPPAAPPRDRFNFIDWATFWTRDNPKADWLIEPLIARGRGHALYAGPKSGKSLVMLAACAAVATGRPFLNNPAGQPQHILYLDYEMTGDDVYERLENYGYGPDDNLTHLHYALLPSIDPLDSAGGAETLVAAAVACQAVHVIIDTTSRAVAGDENDADTFRTLYRLCGLRLKSLGIGYTRLDHSGKDFEKGQRGSSAKNDDVDVVQQLVRRDGGVTIKATHRRMQWVPELVELGIEEHDGIMTYTTPETLHPTGTFHVVKWLDDHDVPASYGRDKVRRILKDAGEGFRNDALSAALKLRKQAENLSPTGPGQVFWGTSGQADSTTGTDPQKRRSETGTGNGDRSGQVTGASVPVVPYVIGDRYAQPPTDETGLMGA